MTTPLWRRPIWILGHLVALTACVLFVRLGFWQLDRLEQRRALNARVERGISAAPVPLDVALGSADPAFRRVTAEGSYAVDATGARCGHDDRRTRGPGRPARRCVAQIL